MTTYEIYIGTELIHTCDTVASLLQDLMDTIADDYDLSVMHIMADGQEITPSIRTWLF